MLGMWLFLASEVLFFGAFLTLYFMLRLTYPPVFAEGSRHLDMVPGGINTGVLLTSSLTMALAVHAAQLGHRRPAAAFLLATAGLGLAFLAVKAAEYGGHFHDRLFPGASFLCEGEQPGVAHTFFSFYFGLTALHTLHVLLGILALAPMAFLVLRGSFRTPPLPAGGDGGALLALRRHRLDVWIFLYPLLYLLP